MKSLSTLEEDGHYGIDASLEISLFEYGLAIKENKDNSYDVIFGVSSDDNGNYISFDVYGGMRESDLPLSDSWADIKSVCNFTGQTEDDFLKDTFLNKVHSLKSYYGIENVFGSTYSTFKIEV